MTQTVSFQCPHCGQPCDAHPEGGRLLCPSCAKPVGTMEEGAPPFDRCLLCQCPHFYIAKDFNQVVGLSLLTVGIVLVPFSYGLSLPVLALIDWILYRRVSTIVRCYRCGAIFRGFEYPKTLKPFRHAIGVRYAKSPS